MFQASKYRKLFEKLIDLLLSFSHHFIDSMNIFGLYHGLIKHGYTYIKYKEFLQEMFSLR